MGFRECTHYKLSAKYNDPCLLSSLSQLLLLIFKHDWKLLTAPSGKIQPISDLNVGLSTAKRYNRVGVIVAFGVENPIKFLNSFTLRQRRCLISIQFSSSNAMKIVAFNKAKTYTKGIDHEVSIVVSLHSPYFVFTWYIRSSFFFPPFFYKS